MNKANRIKEITTALSAGTKPAYYGEERLPEMKKLSRQMRDITFNEEHAENMELGVMDVLEHLKHRNEELGNPRTILPRGNQTPEGNTLFGALQKILTAKETRYVGAAAAVALAVASAVTIVQRR